MSRPLLVIASLLSAPAAASGPDAVDTSGAGALIAQAMDHSEVMANLRHLSDIIGPRLSGSTAMRRANDWTAERFRAYGLTAALEPYTFGVTWERGTVVAPAGGSVHPGDHRAELGLDGGHRRQDAHRPRRAGGPVHARQPGGQQGQGARRLGPAADAVSALEPRRPGHDGRRLRAPGRGAPDQGSSHRRHVRRRGARPAPVPARSPVRAQGGRRARDAGRRLQGARPDDDERVAQPARAAARTWSIAHEDYAMLERQIDRGRESAARGAGGEHDRAGCRCSSGIPWRRSAAASGRARWSSSARTSTAGTWGRASRTTAPARWSCSRRPAPSRSPGLKPKRTIRFILFSGEEEGLLGSRAYAAAHAAEADSIQAVLVLDNGTGAITGQALQGRTELEGLWRAAARPGGRLGADSVRERRTRPDRPPQLPALRRAGVQLRPALRGATTTPTTRRSTPTTKPCRAT